MRISKGDRALFFITATLMMLFSGTILFMPLGEQLSRDGDITPTVILGGLFWGFFLLATICLIILKLHVRSQTKRAGRRAGEAKRRFRLYHTKAGLVSSILSIAALAGFVVAMILTNYQGYLCYVFLSIFAFSFQMQFMLNGKIFTQMIANNKKKESVKSNSSD